MVEMVEPYKGYVYDPACGSGGMFVQSQKFLEEHSGSPFNISIYGQESNPTTWKLAKMNLAIRGIENNLGSKNADTFHDDLHKALKADFILANPPFNDSDWGGAALQDDPRWKWGVPPTGNANYAWLSHMVDKLGQTGIAAVVLANGSLSSNTSNEGEIRKNFINADLVDCIVALHMVDKLGQTGIAAVVLANGSLSSNTSNEGEIRKNFINADLVDCIVALPDKLFYTTGIPVCIWFLNRDKKNKGQTLFIDARKQGEMVTRRLRELSNEDIRKIADTYINYKHGRGYEDVQGFCKVATLDEIRAHDYILTPGRYVGIEEVEDDGEPFEEKMDRLTTELAKQFQKSKELEEEIRKQLGGIGYEF